MVQTIPNFYASHSEKIFFFLPACMKYLLNAKNTCFLPKCKYIKEMKQNWMESAQVVNAAYGRFSGIGSLEKLLQGLDMFLTMFRENSTNKAKELIPSTENRARFFSKREFWDFMRSIQKTNTTQTSVSIFTERSERDKQTIFEKKQLNKVSLFLNTFVMYCSSVLGFKISLLNQLFSESLEIRTSLFIVKKRLKTLGDNNPREARNPSRKQRLTITKDTFWLSFIATEMR